MAERPWKKILVPTDFSDYSRQAFDYALTLAQEFGCEIVLLNVLEPLPAIGSGWLTHQNLDSRDDLGAAKQKLDRLAARPGLKVSIKATVSSGEAIEEIAAVAREVDADLIVIATHGHTSWRHFCLGRTAAGVARRALCPVLVVREKEHEFL